MTRIKFGTSGWRAILADEFTFENVGIVTQAICDHIRGKGEIEKGVVVGYDTRFMGRRFALEAAEILKAMDQGPASPRDLDALIDAEVAAWRTRRPSQEGAVHETAQSAVCTPDPRDGADGPAGDACLG